MINTYTVSLRGPEGKFGVAVDAHSDEEAAELALADYPMAELTDSVFFAVTKIITTGN